MILTSKLGAEYEELLLRCRIASGRDGEVTASQRKLLAGRARYEAVGKKRRVPWWWIGITHGLECDYSFARHLHNGDPLSKRTVSVPAGRPDSGSPPFAWEESAEDALKLKGLQLVGEWTLAQALYQWERYNGFGYRDYHPTVPTPYLWGGSTYYTAGKYVGDGKWSATAVSNQIGAGVMLRYLVATGEVCLCKH